MGRSDGHPWGDPIAITGEFRWPRMGRFAWPPSRQDPESKGKVEAVVRFTKSDLIPYEGFSSLDEANQAGGGVV